MGFRNSRDAVESAAVAADWATDAVNLIPTAIVVAIGISSLVVVSIGLIVGVLSFVGYKRIKKEAKASAREVARNVLETYMKSQEFQVLVKDRVSEVSAEKLLGDVRVGLTGEENENGNGQNSS